MVYDGSSPEDVQCQIDVANQGRKCTVSNFPATLNIVKYTDDLLTNLPTLHLIRCRSSSIRTSLDHCLFITSCTDFIRTIGDTSTVSVLDN